MEQKRSIESIALCLCPLFIVTESFAQGLAIGILSSLTLLATGLIVGLLRKLVVFELRILCILLTTSTTAAIITQILASQYYSLYQVLGIYLPFIAINSLTLTLTEKIFFAKKIAALLKEFLSYAMSVILFFSLFGLIRGLLISSAITAQPGHLNTNTFFEKEIAVLFLLAIFFFLLNLFSYFKKKGDKVVS